MTTAQLDEDGFDYAYVKASGRSNYDCWVLGYRWETEQFSTTELESWILRLRPDRRTDGTFPVEFDMGHGAWWTGLWCSQSGKVFVSDSASQVYVRQSEDSPGPGGWVRHPLIGVVSGVWGLDDEHVYVWSVRGHDNMLFCWNGHRFEDMPSPGRISTMGGVNADLLYAVGYEGLLAQWRGGAWRTIPLPTRENFTGLHVASEDEIYAVTEHGKVFEGSESGWVQRTQHHGGLLGVAKFAGEVWLAGGDEGLLRLEPRTNVISVFKAKVTAGSFEARDNLIICCDSMIAGTSDGKEFRATASNTLRKGRFDKPPLWLPARP